MRIMKRTSFFFTLTLIVVVLMTTSLLFGLEKPSKLPPCCQDSAKKKNNLPNETEIYQKLLITRASIENGKIILMGETDLPAGAKLKIYIINGSVNAEPMIVKEKTVEINNSRFTTTLSIPSSLDSQNIKVEVLFDPKVQTAGVSEKIPRSGVNLTGDAVESTDGRNIMKISQSIVIEDTLTHSPIL